MKATVSVCAITATLFAPLASSQGTQQGQTRQPGVDVDRQPAGRMSSQSANPDMRWNANRFVIGKLVDSRTVNVSGAHGKNRHRLLKLESHSGEQIIVDMGQVRSPSAMGFKHGDLIVAMGKGARLSGSPVLYAHYVGELQDLARQRSAMRQGDDGSASR